MTALPPVWFSSSSANSRAKLIHHCRRDGGHAAGVSNSINRPPTGAQETALYRSSGRMPVPNSLDGPSAPMRVQPCDGCMLRSTRPVRPGLMDTSLRDKNLYTSQAGVIPGERETQPVYARARRLRRALRRKRSAWKRNETTSMVCASQPARLRSLRAVTGWALGLTAAVSSPPPPTWCQT